MNTAPTVDSGETLMGTAQPTPNLLRTDGRGRVRSVLAVGTGVLACLCLLASVIGLWTYRTVFDTDAWVERMLAQSTPGEVRNRTDHPCSGKTSN